MNPLTFVHVALGSIALLSGAAALSLRKGSPMHGKAGTLFCFAMLGMAGTGALVAASISERGTAVIGILTCYLVATSWATARNRSGEAGRFELVAFVVALLCCATMAAFAVQALNSPNGRFDSLPAAAHYPFAALMGLAALLDLNFILRRRLYGVQRIARHLWRMCAALFIAAASFFLGQQDEFPVSWKGAFIWFVPPFAALAAMLFWLVRVRVARAFRNWPPRRPAPAPERLAAERA